MALLVNMTNELDVALASGKDIVDWVNSTDLSLVDPTLLDLAVRVPGFKDALLQDMVESTDRSLPVLVRELPAWERVAQGLGLVVIRLPDTEETLTHLQLSNTVVENEVSIRVTLKGMRGEAYE